MAPRGPTFTGLPFDVLCLVRDSIVQTELRRHAISVSRLEESAFVDWIAAFERNHPLDSLSRVSHSIRAVCCPTMFSRIKLSGRLFWPPRAIRPYARILWITRGDFNTRGCDYLEMFRDMIHLRTIFWEPEKDPSMLERDISVALSCPTLTTFMMRGVPLRGVVTARLTAPCLQILDVSQSWRDIYSVTPGEVDAETQCLESLISQVAPRLQVLRIPGESCRLSFIASTSWPHLRELVIRGRTPQEDLPFSRIFPVMPRLRILAVAVVPTLVLLPENAPEPAQLNLQRLTITNIHPEEGIFLRLSSELTELALRDQPRYYRRRQHTESYNSMSVLLCRAAMRIIGRLAFVGVSLRRLEIVVREDGSETQLLSLIAMSCPCLLFFELHQYRADDTAFMRLPFHEIDPHIDTIAKTLTPLRQLRVLRLNLDLGLYSAKSTYDTFCVWDPFLQAQAGVIARILHWLDIISFLTTHMAGSAAWRTWYPRRSPGGDIGVEEELSSNYAIVDQRWF